MIPEILSRLRPKDGPFYDKAHERFTTFGTTSVFTSWPLRTPHRGRTLRVLALHAGQGARDHE